MIFCWMFSLGVQNYWNARRAELQDLYREFGEIEIRRDMNQMYRITLPGNRFFWMFKEISNFLQDIFFGCGFATADDLRELVRRHSLRRDSFWVARRVVSHVCRQSHPRIIPRIRDAPVAFQRLNSDRLVGTTLPPYGKWIHTHYYTLHYPPLLVTGYLMESQTGYIQIQIHL